MSELTTFSFLADEQANLSRDIRVVDVSGDPWFVVKDVLAALDYADGTAPGGAILHTPKEWKGMQPIHTPGGPQQMSVLSEQGLYFFVNRSDKPKALPFQKWLAGEVLPSIRRTGSYNVQQPAHKPGYLLAAELAPTYVAAAEAFGITGNQGVLAANQAITKITAFDLLAAMGQTHLIAPNNEPLLTPSDLAGRLGVGVRAVNPMLIDCGLQEDHRDHKNRLYYELTDYGRQYGVYQDTGKQHSDGTPVRQIKWRSETVSILEARTQIESETEQLTL